MPSYIVDSAILRSGKDPKTCATGAAKMLTSNKIKDITVKSCYCCTDEKRVAFLIDAPSQDALLEALEKIDLPVSAIKEVQEVPAS
ncbi:MAG: hypothetical protein ACQCN3_01635 [Candidatus Bathyarchaeia archaeon]|jgi:uncharacterized membrane protein